jgi:hypothetical protein
VHAPNATSSCGTTANSSASQSATTAVMPCAPSTPGAATSPAEPTGSSTTSASMSGLTSGSPDSQGSRAPTASTPLASTTRNARSGVQTFATSPAGDVRRFLELIRDDVRKRRLRNRRPHGAPPDDVSPATLAKHLRQLGACLQAAHTEGYAHANPVRQLHKTARRRSARAGRRTTQATSLRASGQSSRTGPWCLPSARRPSRLVCDSHKMLSR